jgi:hypothetical protein
MLSLLFSLLIFVLVVCIAIWLIRLLCAAIPGCPPFVPAIAIALVALIALAVLFGDFSGENFHLGYHHFHNW